MSESGMEFTLQQQLIDVQSQLSESQREIEKLEDANILLARNCGMFREANKKLREALEKIQEEHEPAQKENGKLFNKFLSREDMVRVADEALAPGEKP